MVKAGQATANDWFQGKVKGGKKGEDRENKKVTSNRLPFSAQLSWQSQTTRGATYSGLKASTRSRVNWREVSWNRNTVRFHKVILILTLSDDQQSPGEYNQQCSGMKRKDKWNETFEGSLNTDNSWDTCMPPNPVTLVLSQIDERLSKYWEQHNR